MNTPEPISKPPKDVFVSMGGGTINYGKPPFDESATFEPISNTNACNKCKPGHGDLNPCFCECHEPISNIDEILSSDHTKGSHADDFSDREPCYCNRKQRIQRLITEARKDQIMQDFNQVSLDTTIDEAIINSIRDNQLAELEATLKENNL